VELYPAVDVRGGRVARSVSVQDPLSVARQLARDGARWVHFVDLDRAHGTGENDGVTRRVLSGSRVWVQVGGGVTSETTIAELIAWGATRVVVGGQAESGVVDRLLARHGAERLAVGIDARDGRVAPRGASVSLALTPLELARRLRAQGARTVVYTDATRDGALSGPDVDGAAAIAALGLDVIASGGVASLDDLRRVRDAGLAGAIVGRALHEGRFTLVEALACVAG